jgi:hypothetical protein
MVGPCGPARSAGAFHAPGRGTPDLEKDDFDRRKIAYLIGGASDSRRRHETVRTRAGFAIADAGGAELN